jgi:hypothetical protein
MWVSTVAYPTCLGLKGLVVVVPHASKVKREFYLELDEYFSLFFIDSLCTVAAKVTLEFLCYGHICSLLLLGCKVCYSNVSMGILQVLTMLICSVSTYILLVAFGFPSAAFTIDGLALCQPQFYIVTLAFEYAFGPAYNRFVFLIQSGS